MRKFLILALLTIPAIAQNVPAPQIGLSGNVGAIGFPILNSGTFQMPADADVTFAGSNVNTSAFAMKVTSAVSLTTTRNLIYPAGRFYVTVENATTGGQAIQIIGPTGTGVAIANGRTVTVWNDGTNYVTAAGAAGPAGATGPAGPTGSTGPNGPNLINSSTSTSFNGLIQGNSTNAVQSDVLPSDTTATTQPCSAISANPTYVATMGALPCAFDGVTLTGTPSSGQVPTATGPTAATWQAIPASVASTACPLQNSTNICITQSPYNASTAGATTTTTSGTFGIGTSGSVTSCSTFLAGNGVLITGAGTAGANYIGTVASCTGTTLTVNPATSTSVANGTNVQHDETAAYLAAVSALNTAGGGNIWIPNGLYLLGGPLLQTSGANAVLPMPVLPNYENPEVSISFKGTQPALGAPPNPGAVLEFFNTTGNSIGGYDSATGGGFPPFTNVWLDMEDVTVIGPTNPGSVGINAGTILDFTARNVVVETTNNATPSNAAGIGIKMPQVQNGLRTQLTNVAEGGYYTGMVLTEHTQANFIYAANSYTCYTADSQGTLSPPIAANSLSIGYAWCGVATVGLTGPSNATPGQDPQTISIQNLDLEQISGNGIYDPHNNLQGIVNFAVPYTYDSTSVCNANVSGGGNLTINALNCQGGANALIPLSHTAGVLYAAANATATSIKGLAGSGAGITTGPTTSTSGDCAQFTGTAGQIADSGGPCYNPVANSTLTVGTSAISANSCTSVSTITMTGTATSSTITISPSTDVSAVTGWSPGSGGQLYFVSWPTSNTVHYYTCNPTGSSITPGSSTTWNVSVR